MPKRNQPITSDCFPICIKIADNIDFNKNIGMQLLSILFPTSEVFWGLSIGSVDDILIKTEKEVTYNGKKYTTPQYLQPSEVSIGSVITFQKRNKK